MIQLNEAMRFATLNNPDSLPLKGWTLELHTSDQRDPDDYWRKHTEIVSVELDMEWQGNKLVATNLPVSGVNQMTATPRSFVLYNSGYALSGTAGRFSDLNLHPSTLTEGYKFILSSFDITFPFSPQYQFSDELLLLVA